MVLLFLTVPNRFLYSQVKNKGNHVVINYSKKDYSASTQNWDIAQDQRGIMYFANNDGLLEFDGTEWRVYNQLNRSIVRALKISREGRIYTGAFNSIGYYFPDEKGVLVFHPLSEKLDSASRNFEDIWKIHEIGNAVYFQSKEFLFKYENDSISTILKDCSFTLSFRNKDNLYFFDSKIGFCLLDENLKLKTLSGSEILNDKEVWSVLPGRNDRLIICTAEYGLFEYDGVQVREWNVPCNEFLKKNQIFCATNIDNSHYVFGTIQNGLLITDIRGFPLQHINSRNGLQNNTVLSVDVDAQRNLWLGLDNGIDYIKINSPLSFLNSGTEIGSGYCSAIYNGVLYLGTNRGLFYKKWLDYVNPLQPFEDFKLVEGSKGQVWGLTVYDNTLFCAHSKGTFIIREGRSKQISDVLGAWKLLTFRDNPDILIGGTYSGLQLFRKNSLTGEWTFDRVIPGINESCRELEVDDSRSTIWMSHGYKGIYRIKLSEKFDSIINLEFYNSKDGLPIDFGLSALKFKEEIVVSSDSGFHYYDYPDNSFKPHRYLENLLGKKKVYRFFPDLSANIWFFYYDNPGVIKLNYDGSYNVETLNFEEFRGSLLHSFESMLAIDQSNFIISTVDGFIHFDPTFIKLPSPELKTLIRQVIIKDQTILFGGNFADITNDKLVIIGDRPAEQLAHMDFRNNTILFKYSANDFENLSNTEYSYMLEGFEDSWSEWSPIALKEYTNLEGGNYLFKVKSRIFSSFESAPVSFRFVVLPPWYLSTLALFFFALLAITSLFFFARYYIKRLEVEKQKLQRKQARELEEKEEYYQRDSLLAKQEIIRLQNEKLEIENKIKQSVIDTKSSELASFAMQITYKNEILNQIKNQLTKVSTKMVHEDSKRQVLGLIKKLDKDTLQDNDWSRFEMHFDQVHEDFLKRIKIKHPSLTPKDLRLAAYLRMNLSSKEIAPLLNISTRGVEISRYRLRRKINIDSKENLVDYLMSFV